MSLSARERKCPDCGNSMCKVMVVQNVHRCVRKEKVENVYDLGRMVREELERAWTQMRKPLNASWQQGAKRALGK